MKVIILAGGFGSRLSEYTNLIPKPMVKIGGLPIIHHIMNHFSKFGFKEFIIALGYKGNVIKEYFINYKSLNSNVILNLQEGNVEYLPSIDIPNWKIELIDTGLSSMTGKRLKLLKDYIGNQPFFLTYGDGLSNVNIKDLLSHHNHQGKIATVTAVHPLARFGELVIKDNLVTEFQEKPQIRQGWINGGFFVFKPEIFNYLNYENAILEKDPLENLAKDNQLSAFKHEGFWQCMDTKRDKDFLEDLSKSANRPW